MPLDCPPKTSSILVTLGPRKGERMNELKTEQYFLPLVLGDPSAKTALTRIEQG